MRLKVVIAMFLILITLLLSTAGCFLFKDFYYTLTVEVIGNGHVLRDPSGTEYKYGTEVKLTAVPGSGSKFVSWFGDVLWHRTVNSITYVIMDNHKTIQAYFE